MSGKTPTKLAKDGKVAKKKKLVNQEKIRKRQETLMKAQKYVEKHIF